MSIEPFEIVINENENDKKSTNNNYHFPSQNRRVEDDNSLNIQPNALFVDQTSTRKKLHKNYIFSQNNAHSFHSAIGPIITIGQYFGVFAIDGVKNPTPEMMTFKMKSFRTIYSCGVTLNILIALYCTIFHIFIQKKEILSSLIPFGIFIGFSLTMIILFLCRSQMWIDLQIKWKKVEQTLDMFYSQSPQLHVKFQIIYIVSEFFDLGDFILANVIKIDTKNKFIEYLKFRGKFLIEPFFGSNTNFFDDWLGILGIYFPIIFIIVLSIRTFTNVFIIFVAIGLTEKYKAINKYISDLIKSNCQTINWSQLKIHYEILSDLVKETDRVISPLILLSIGGNIYTICSNLLNGIIPKHDGIFNAIYFFGGFVLLVIKTFAAIFFAAKLNDESKKPISLLSKCPIQDIKFQPQWLQVQLSIDDVALTAMKFFSITRKFLITVITTIISYEIILLQFF